MTIVSNDPTWLPFISTFGLFSYFAAVSSVAVVYDWALTFGQEFELVWKKRWSFMTILYICVRYIGIIYSAVTFALYLPFSMTDTDCQNIYFMYTWMPVGVYVMLGVIMMTRIHAMYGRSKKMLILLVVVLLASTIVSGLDTAETTLGQGAGLVPEESILLGYHICLVLEDLNGVMEQTDDTYWIRNMILPIAIWEILTFVLAIWIVIKHFRELRQSSTGSTIGDCFTVLIKSHAFYFAGFATVACFGLVGSALTGASATFSLSVEGAFYSAVLQVAQTLQMFVLGPRLILSIREHHAKLVARSDEGTGMTSIHFQAGGDALSGGDV